MFRTIVRTYALLSLLFLLALAIFFVARLTVIRNENIGQSTSSFLSIRSRSAEAVSAAGSAAEVKELLRPRRDSAGEERLEALILYTVDQGVAYLWARSPAYTEGGFTGGSGVPRMEYNELTQMKYTATLDGEPSYILEALYTVIDRRDIYPLLRLSLIAVLLVAMVATVLAIIGARKRSEREAALAPRPVESRSDISDNPMPEVEVEGEEAGFPEEPDKEGNEASALEMTPPKDEIDAEQQEAFTGASGLSPEAHLLKRLSLELSRAAQHEQDLTLLILEYPSQKQYDERYLLHAKQLLDYFGFEDLAFEKGDRFVVIFPNTTLREGLRTVERYQKELLAAGPTSEADHPRAGLSSRNGRLIDGSRLLAEASLAVKKSHDTPGRIVGFEPDPEKYRAVI